MELEPRSRAGGVLGEPCPSSEVSAVVEPRQAVIEEVLVGVSAYGEAPTTGSRDHRPAAGDGLA